MTNLPKQHNNIGLFVDVQNIYYTTRQAFGRQFNYRQLWQDISQQGTIVTANAYAIDRGDPQQQQFQQVLHNIGFTIKLKPYISRSDGSSKGDWDVGIALDAIDSAEKIDTLILLSGDGDFDLLLEKARSRFDVTTQVYGVSSLTAHSLIQACHEFHEINERLLMPK